MDLGHVGTWAVALQWPLSLGGLPSLMTNVFRSNIRLTPNGYNMNSRFKDPFSYENK